MNQSNLQNILLYSLGAAILGCILINLNEKFINNHINEKYNNVKAFILIFLLVGGALYLNENNIAEKVLTDVKMHTGNPTF